MSDVQAAEVGGSEGTLEVTPESVEGTEPIGDLSTEPVGESAPAQTFKVTVGGVDQEVTLEDLQSGFMRQADYTRKTQELAQQRQRLAQAEAIANSLDADPEGTLRALAEAFRVQFDGVDGESVEIDPNESRLQQLERREQEREAQRVRAEIDREIDTLLNEYGDFDLGEVIAHAANNGMTVTAAYRDLNFDKFAGKAKVEQQITDQKREAVVVEGGAHRTAVTEQQKPAGSIREAWAQATKSLGL